MDITSTTLHNYTELYSKNTKGLGKKFGRILIYEYACIINCNNELYYSLEKQYYNIYI